ncbi:hypothetical protein ACFV3R_11145 [Streptomyces sp. NPDC059740]|uniref:hypothetical protein n=1 Tax=Streptomyces sp. NPDC059740 TaxID=3346926 RepID=UPI0036610D7F
MKKLKATAVVCGALAAVCLGTPAFADDEPTTETGVESIASEVPAWWKSDDPQVHEQTRKQAAADAEARKKAFAESEPKRLAQPTADAKYNTWIKNRDARQRQAIVGLSDSQTLGLNPFRPGYY